MPSSHLTVPHLWPSRGCMFFWEVHHFVRGSPTRCPPQPTHHFSQQLEDNVPDALWDCLKSLLGKVFYTSSMPVPWISPMPAGASLDYWKQHPLLSTWLCCHLVLLADFALRKERPQLPICKNSVFFFTRKKNFFLKISRQKTKVSIVCIMVETRAVGHGEPGSKIIGELILLKQDTA